MNSTSNLKVNVMGYSRFYEENKGTSCHLYCIIYGADKCYSQGFSCIGCKNSDIKLRYKDVLRWFK